MLWNLWDRIAPVVGCLGAIAILAVFGIAFKSVEADYDRNHDTFQEVYSDTGIFGSHPLEILGPNEVVGSEFHGQFFAAFFIVGAGAGEIDGSSQTTLVLRFKWQDPSGAYKVIEYPYSRINLRIDNNLDTPQLKLIFSRDTLKRELSLYNDLTIYDYNTFFPATAAIDIALNQATYDEEMYRLQLK